MSKSKRQVDDSDVATMGDDSSVSPCVGLPVQFHTLTETLPGWLQRQSLTDPDLWDVKVSLNGPGMLVLRSAVRQSDEPKPGCWTMLPIYK